MIPRGDAEMAFPTLFKPIDLPKHPAPDDDEHEAVLTCLGAFLGGEAPMARRPSTRSTSAITSEVADRQMRTMLAAFVELHQHRNMCIPALVKYQLATLPIGNYWGIYLAAQNSVLLLHRESGQATVAMVWEVQASNAQITGETESPKQSIPRAAVRVEDWGKRIQEGALQSFSELLADLAGNEREKAQPTAHKAGQQQNETREVINANLFGVEYLLCVLGGEPLTAKDSVMRKGLHKKQCDEVQYESSELPWRRAPVWAAVKTLAHAVCLQCQDNSGTTTIKAELSYKLFTQNFLAQVLDAALPSDSILALSFDISQSAVLEAARKLVRRQVKMGKVLQAVGRGTSGELKQLHGTSTKTVKRAMALVEGQWNKLCKAPNRCVLDPMVLAEKGAKGIVHKLTSSGALLERLHDTNAEFFLRRARERMAAGAAPEEPHARGYLKKSDWFLDNPAIAQHHLDAAHSRWRTAPQDIISVLNDLQEQIWSDFSSLPDNVEAFAGDSSKLPDILCLHKRYVKIGLQVFKGDPRGCGEIALTALTLVAIVDMLATKAHPLLGEHPLGIASGLFKRLFVTADAQKRHLHILENYVRKRNSSARYSTTTIEGSRSCESFSIRFAQQDSGMKTTHREIMNQCMSDQHANEKMRRKRRKEHDDLMAYNRRNGCSCRWDYDKYDNRHKSHHCLSCKKEIEAKQITMEHYEKLLPDNTIRQWAVIFELKQSDLLICQRQILFDFLEHVCDQDWNSESDDCYLWSQEYRLTPFRRSSNCSSLTTCELGSVRKKWSRSHYSTNHHIAAKLSFIVPHDYETVLMGPSGPVGTAIPSWWTGTKKEGMRGRLCTMNIPKHSDYHSLQPLINGYAHSENDAIASECPQSITLAEFRSCGSLRAGPRHQLIRLAACLRQKVLSLERPEPVALILCALWQAGPRLKLSENVHEALLHFRQPCQQLLDAGFVADLTEMLDETLAESQENWSYHNRLVAVTAIANYLRVHTAPIDGDCEAQQGLVALLDKCTDVAKTWIGSIMERANNCGDETEMQRLRAKLVDVTVAGTLSLTADMLGRSRAKVYSRRVGDFLFFRAIFNDNFSPAEIDDNPKNAPAIEWNAFRRMLILQGFAHAERLQETVETTSVSALNSFLKSYWSKSGDIAKGVGTVKWTQYKTAKSCWYATVRLKENGRRLTYLQMDTVSGAFFVDGLPCKSLPRSVSASNTYKRQFGTSIFIVQPTGSGGYRTQMPVNGCHFEFYPPESCLFDADSELFGDGEPIILKETIADNSKAILLPHSVIAGDFPAMFVGEYSHWYELEKGKVHFQPVKYNNNAYMDNGLEVTSMKTATSHILDNATRMLFEVATGRKLVDVRGRLFKHLQDNVFSRLSPPSLVHVWLPNPSGNKEDKQLLSEDFFGSKGGFIVQLPQLQNIRFDVNTASGTVRSREFGGKVSMDQNLDTLIGLHQGIVLEGASDSVNKMFLCPHGKVKRISKDGNVVNIYTRNLRTPPFFRFEVRPELRDLKSCSANRLQWLFLSQLHLATGGLLSDPFTGTTGTQRALDIFRSGRCAGNPLTSINVADFGPGMQHETRLLLEMLTVSTARADYHSMEKTERNDAYHALCAPASIGFVIKNRLDEIRTSLAAVGQSLDSEELNLPIKAKGALSKRTNMLCARSYWQSRECYPKDTMLSADEEQKVFGRTLHGKVHHSPPSKPLLQVSPGFGTQTVFNMQHLCYAAQNKGYEVQPSTSETLSTLLCSKSTGNRLTGVTKRTQLSGTPLSCFRGIAGLDSEAATGDMSRDECLPAFEQIWLDLYHFAQSVVPNSADGKFSFGALLGHVLSEYPSCGPHLHQLVVVAANAKKFPTAPSHKFYKKPYEQSFISCYVDAVVDKRLERFTESEPHSHTYDSRRRATKNYSHTCWEERRDDHHKRRMKAKTKLETKIISLWNAGKSSISSHDVSNVMVANSSLLELEITALFTRWRNAIELQSFLDKVKKKLASRTLLTALTVRSPNPPSLVSDLATDSAPAHSGKCDGQRNNLVLDTAVDLMHPVKSALIVAACKMNVRRKKEYTYAAVTPMTDVSTGEHLDLTSEITNKHPQYVPLWGRLTEELQKSWTLAQDETDVDPSVLESPSVKRDIKSRLQGHAEEAQKELMEQWKIVENALSPTFSGDIVYGPVLQLSCGLWNAITPYCVLKTHFHSGGNAKGTKAIAVSKLLTNFALSIRSVQRARRCLRRLAAGPTAAVHLLHDLKETGCEGWSPQEYPEFLALEIDNDYLMRSVQARVAFEMLDDYGGKTSDDYESDKSNVGNYSSNDYSSDSTHSDADIGSDANSDSDERSSQECHQNRMPQNRTMQMNMGAGKSAVIMPCVLATAGAGRLDPQGAKRLVRATVLSSLYSTNAADWQLKLGGLLDRRVLPLLCRRDLPITEAIAAQLLNTCIAARDRGDVIVTVPEHRLSLENKSLELASEDTSSPDLAASRALQRLLHLSATEGREILDESDEILSPLYQLIYTLGAQLRMEGAPLRWAVHAAIYGTLARYGRVLQQEFGAEVIELTRPVSQDESTGADSHEYPGLRLLDDGSAKADDAYKKICELVVEDVLAGRANGIQTTLTAEELEVFLDCVRGSPDPKLLARINPDRRPQRSDALPQPRQVLALTLRGLLNHDVLRLCLSKRWRVNYGAHPSRPNYDMAVPMKAKDVAAEKNEFGHPDVAVSLTFASYYNGGLSQGQLQSSFTSLMKLPESKRKAVYRQWAERLPAGRKDGIAALEGVNLEDKELFKTKLYPAFHKHMDVINFWLLNKVFPVQAKQFPKKLVATAPDLCRSAALCPAWRAITTGFSGTDDLSLVLPETIKQHNMAELQGTNGVQLRRLLRPENNQYIALRAEEKTMCNDEDTLDTELKFASKNSTEQILDILGTERIIKNKVNVVLDPGALVLQKTNAEFAKSWLGKRPDMEAAVFFEDDSIKVLIWGSSNPIPFAVSSYAHDMSKCLLYLDDIHTRGSDFRLPLATRALLTLGKNLPKDKFCQSCMRLRQLGVGQSLTFVASPEVHRVLKLSFFKPDVGRLIVHLDTQSGHILQMDRGSKTAIVHGILLWTLSNTVRRICDLLPYLAGQTVCALRKARAFSELVYVNSTDSSAPGLRNLRLRNTTAAVSTNSMVFDGRREYTPLLDDITLKTLAGRCIENEILALFKLYGHGRSMDTLPRIVDRVLDSATESDGSNIGDSNTAATVSSLKQRVRDIAPQVQRSCAMLDEEQERELEAELEEEAQIERPPPKTAKKPHVSKGLIEVVSQISNSTVRVCNGATDIEDFCAVHLTSMDQLFQRTSLHAMAKGQLDGACMFVTKDFSDTVLGVSGLDNYMKDIRWILRVESSSVLIFLSNFEAEHYSHLLARHTRAGSSKCGNITQIKLYPFAALVRLGQPRLFLRASIDPPAAAHVLAGSVHADPVLAKAMRNFLGLVLRTDPVPWDALLSKGLVERDGFVPRNIRETGMVTVEFKKLLTICDREQILAVCPFSISPVKFLTTYYTNARHLGEELSVSVIGRFLGVSEIEQ